MVCKTLWNFSEDLISPESRAGDCFGEGEADDLVSMLEEILGGPSPLSLDALGACAVGVGLTCVNDPHNELDAELVQENTPEESLWYVAPHIKTSVVWPRSSHCIVSFM